MIVSQTLARKLFPNQDPLEQRLRPGRGEGPWYNVVGIAADVRNAGLTTPGDPEYYVIRTMSPRDARATKLGISSHTDVAGHGVVLSPGRRRLAGSGTTG